jgi:hypothetical protein
MKVSKGFSDSGGDMPRKWRPRGAGGDMSQTPGRTVVRLRRKRPHAGDTDGDASGQKVIDEAVEHALLAGQEHPWTRGDASGQKVIDEGLGISGAGPEVTIHSEVSAVAEKLSQLERHRLEADIKKSKGQREKWLRDSWRIAGETLDVAHEAVSRQTRRSREDFSAEEVRETVNVLQDEAMWDDLLRTHNLADNYAAKAAVRKLIVCIKSMEIDEVDKDVLPRLLEQIDFLRDQIEVASRHTGPSLPHEVVQEFLGAASNVTWEVMGGLVAVSTTAEVAGVQVVPEVVYTAVGLAVAASVKQLYKRIARKARKHTIPAQLKRYHPELVKSVGQLVDFLPWLVPDPPPEGALETAQSVHVAAGFLVRYVEQLANSFAWPERVGYLGVLHHTKDLLDGIRNIVAGQRGDISQAQEDLIKVNGRLQGFNDCIQNLRI